MPTLGLFLTSLLDPTQFTEQGWWNIISEPSLATLDNYDQVFDTEAITSALWTTVLISVGGTILPIFVASMAGYAFAWLEFPGRDWLFIVVIAMLVVPIQMALIPIFSLYSDVGLFDTVLGLVLFHTAFGLPFAIFLLRNFFIGIPKDLMEAARIDGASEIRIFLRADPAARAAGDRLARDLPVPLDVERPARRAHVRARDAADHGRDLHAAAPVRLEHRADRAGRVRLAGDPARGLLRLPAVLRPGPARRLRQVAPVTPRVAIVGSGLGGFVAYATLRHRPEAGLEPAEIAVFGDDPDPAGAWRPRAAAIRQRLMRSESDGHCWPTSFPGLAAREAARRRDLAPLILSVCDRYRPTVELFLRHVDELRASSRWDESFRQARVERIRAVDGGFELDGHGVFRHVLLAPGHPGLARPAELEGDPARRARLRAARVRVARRDRRRRDGGRDRVAERARRGRRGRLGAPPRARAAAAQRRPAAVHEARPRRLPRRAARTSGRSCCAASASRPIRPAAAGTSRSSGPRARAASASSRS